MASLNFTDKQLKKLIKDIESGAVDMYNLPTDLYHAIADYFKDALYKGFGGTLVEFGGKDLALLNELRENIYMFSAAKTYNEVRAVQDTMFDANGDLVSQREFVKEAAATFEQFNEQWGSTEYNTAVAQAQMASKWNEIQRNKDFLPLLVYQAIGEGLGCDICAPLDGLTAPVDDVIWDSVTPTNHFNCQCIVIQEDRENARETDKEARDEIVSGVTGNMQDVFKMNPGKDGYIFSPEHPYFQVEPKDRDFARTNFGLEIPSLDSNPLFKNCTLELDEATLYRGDIRDKGDVFTTKADMQDYKLDGEIKNKAGFHWLTSSEKYAEEYATTQMSESRGTIEKSILTTVKTNKLSILDFEKMDLSDAVRFTRSLVDSGITGLTHNEKLLPYLAEGQKITEKELQKALNVKYSLNKSSILNNGQTYADFDKGIQFKKWLQDNGFDGYRFSFYKSGDEIGIIKEKAFNIIDRKIL